MATATDATDGVAAVAADGAEAVGAPPRPSWRQWVVQVLICGAFYAAYDSIRAVVDGGAAGAAFRHARQVVRAERALHVFVERGMQRVAMHSRLAVQGADIYYGTIHFVVPVVVLIVLFRAFPERYRLWRNTLGILCALALLGFAFYPLAPPRLLGDHWHFVDTNAVFGGLGPLDSGSMKDTNLYAAMPSLHIGWSTWCATALVPVLRNRLARVALVAYPLVTLTVIVVTANHYILDGVGGLVWLAVAYAIGRRVTR